MQRFLGSNSRQTLQRIGFYRFQESDEIASLKQTLVETGWVFESLDSRILGEIDYVNLPEGDAASFLEYYSKALGRFGVCTGY